MFTRAFQLGLLLAGVVGLSGCGDDQVGAAPKGQVIAVADGMEITQRELAAEMDMIGAAASEEPEKVRQVALQKIIARKLLAREARVRELDDSPDFGLLKQRAEDVVLETLLQRSMTRNLPAPTIEAAQRYMSDNPDLFAQRKLFQVEQIRIPSDEGRALLDRLKPLATLEEVQALLEREGIRFQRGIGTLDAMQSPPALVKQVLALPSDEIFILPMQDSLSVNRIIETKTVPVDDAEAQEFALNYLRRKGISDTLKNQLAEIMNKHKDKIRYQPGYEVAGAVQNGGGG